ncbi:type II toxin-antitoxin system RelE family toxin [Corynebacterium phoceense]|uniref:type II toxin-antitoxin system RelE family toxin n=1 Tax=Corynebacterium phoceense TaxID=1686286 RepID=UPI001E2A92A0|nr:hypothetical protein [Corynebacterium phoceense]
MVADCVLSNTSNALSRWASVYRTLVIREILQDFVRMPFCPLTREWRYRVGAYRILALIHESTITIEVFAGGRRDTIYR